MLIGRISPSLAATAIVVFLVVLVGATASHADATGYHASQECMSDWDCPEGYVCVGGECVPAGPAGCQSDWDCPEGYVCVGGECVPAGPAGCQSDYDCPEGYVCEYGECVAAGPAGCQSDYDCPEGYVCEYGECVAAGPPGCQSNADCSWGICEGGQCVAECSSASDCPADHACIGGACVTIGPAAECTSDLDCPAGCTCVGGQCVTTGAECTSTFDCPEGYSCVNGGCVPTEPGSCEEGGVRVISVCEDCWGPRLYRICENGQWSEEVYDNGCPLDHPRPGCLSDAECPAGETCGSNCLCVPRQGGCQSDAECPKGNSCVGGQCVPQPTGCQSDNDCPEGYSCVNGGCVVTPKPECQSDYDCPEGYTCIDGSCVLAPACDPSDESQYKQVGWDYNVQFSTLGIDKSSYAPGDRLEVFGSVVLSLRAVFLNEYCSKPYPIAYSEWEKVDPAQEGVTIKVQGVEAFRVAEGGFFSVTLYVGSDWTAGDYHVSVTATGPKSYTTGPTTAIEYFTVHIETTATTTSESVTTRTSESSSLSKTTAIASKTTAIASKTTATASKTTATASKTTATASTPSTTENTSFTPAVGTATVAGVAAANAVGAAVAGAGTGKKDGGTPDKEEEIGEKVKKAVDNYGTAVDLVPGISDETKEYVGKHIEGVGNMAEDVKKTSDLAKSFQKIKDLIDKEAKETKELGLNDNTRGFLQSFHVTCKVGGEVLQHFVDKVPGGEYVDVKGFGEEVGKLPLSAVRPIVQHNRDIDEASELLGEQ